MVVAEESASVSTFERQKSGFWLRRVEDLCRKYFLNNQISTKLYKMDGARGGNLSLSMLTDLLPAAVFEASISATTRGRRNGKSVGICYLIRNESKKYPTKKKHHNIKNVKTQIILVMLVGST